MKTQLIRFAADDKIMLQGLLYSPEEKTDKVILHIHGMAGNFYESDFIDAMARIFTDNGWAFFCPNTRGHDYIADFATTEGEYKRIGDAYEVFAESVHDIRGATDFLAQQGFTSIALQGHSLGGPKVAYYVAQTQDNRINKLIFVSPADMVGLSEKEADFDETMAMAQKMIAAGKGHDIMPNPIFGEEGWDGYLLSANTYVDLSKRDNPVDVINTYDKDKPSDLAKITIPILATFGTENESVLMEPPQALDILKSKAPSCPQFDSAVIQGANHSYSSHAEELAETIIIWVKR